MLKENKCEQLYEHTCSLPETPERGSDGNIPLTMGRYPAWATLLKQGLFPP